MEEEVCAGGGGHGPINNSNATAPFGGGVEQLAHDVGVECTAPKLEAELPTRTDFTAATLGLELDVKMPFLHMLQTLYSTTNTIHSDDPLKNNSLKLEHQIVEVVDSCMPKLHSPAMPEAKCLSLQEKGEADNSAYEYRNDLTSLKTCQSKRTLGSCKMRKPKRAKVVVENKKDAEKQRMTHIAVERNRRRLMSDYLVVLRSLLPHDYATKSDQASIVGGVIDYVKQLEHNFKYLENQKSQINMEEIRLSETSKGVASTSTTTSSDGTLEQNCGTKSQLRKKANVNIMVVHTHANLRIECEYMKQSQLIKFLAAVEDLGLTILHLNISSIHISSIYSLSLKMEDECKIRSAEEISGSVGRVLNSLNISSGTRSSSDTNQNQDEARNVKNEY